MLEGLKDALRANDRRKFDFYLQTGKSLTGYRIKGFDDVGITILYGDDEPPKFVPWTAISHFTPEGRL